MSNPNIPGLFDFGVKRTVTKAVSLRFYPGWTIQRYVDDFGRETFDAVSDSGAMSPLEASFADALHFVKTGHPVLKP